MCAGSNQAGRRTLRTKEELMQVDAAKSRAIGYGGRPVQLDASASDLMSAMSALKC